MRLAALLATTLLAASQPLTALAEEAAPVEATPKPVRQFSLGVATREYFVAFGAQLVSVGVLFGAGWLVAMEAEKSAGGDHSASATVGWIAGLIAPLVVPIASACLLTLFEDRPELKLRAGLRAWWVGMGATFLAEAIGVIVGLAAFTAHDQLPARTGAIGGAIALVVLPPLLQVVAFDGGREPELQRSAALVPFLLRGGGGIGLAGAF